MIKKIAVASLSLVLMMSTSLAGVYAKNYFLPVDERSEILVYHHRVSPGEEVQDALSSDKFLNDNIDIWDDVGVTYYPSYSDSLDGFTDLDDEDPMLPPSEDDGEEEEDKLLPELELPQVDDNIIPPLGDILPDLDSGVMGPADGNGTELPEDTLNPPEDTLNPPDDTLNPPEDTLNPPEDTLNPPDDTLNPPEDTLNPPDVTLDSTGENTLSPPSTGDIVLDPPVLNDLFDTLQ